jgi:hypothetical protein
MYAYKMKEEFSKEIDKYLEDDNVLNIHIVVPKNYLNMFMKVIFREEFAEYSISQVSGREFEVARKELYL